MISERKTEIKTGPNFLQKSVGRQLRREDSYTIWRRCDNNHTSYLSVIWHKTRRSTYLSSGVLSDSQAAEDWTLKQLTRLQYEKFTLDLIRLDFDFLVNDPSFKVTTVKDTTPQYLDLSSFYSNHSGIEGEPDYLADGLWLWPDGHIGER